jgi:hypothetical protein
MTRIITGLFDKRGDAERAVEHLVQELGMDPNRVEIHTMSGAKPRRQLSGEEHRAYGESLRRGAIVVSAEVADGRLERALAAIKECGAIVSHARPGGPGEGRTAHEAPSAAGQGGSAAS